MADNEVIELGIGNMVLVYIPDSNNIEANNNTVLCVLENDTTDRNLAKEFVLIKKADGNIVACRSTYTDEDMS